MRLLKYRLGKKPTAPLLTMGVTKTGYALYAKQGAIYFCVRYGQKSFQRIATIQGKQSKLNVIVRFNAENLSLQVGRKLDYWWIKSVDLTTYTSKRKLRGWAF